MGRHFVDTACMVKLYRPEPDSPAVRVLLARDDELVISELAAVEFRSAMYGLVRQGLLAVAQAATYIEDFNADLQDYEVVQLDSQVTLLAQSLIETHSATNRLRTLDSLQLASAIIVRGMNPMDDFVTTDTVLGAVAAAEGFVVLP